jgi:hypothetical protein
METARECGLPFPHFLHHDLPVMPCQAATGRAITVPHRKQGEFFPFISSSMKVAASSSQPFNHGRILHAAVDMPVFGRGEAAAGLRWMLLPEESRRFFAAVKNNPASY